MTTRLAKLTPKLDGLYKQCVFQEQGRGREMPEDTNDQTCGCCPSRQDKKVCHLFWKDPGVSRPEF